jgi:hypothetical protein
MRQLAEWFVALIEIWGAGMVGYDLGAWLDRRDTRRRLERDAIERLIAESDAYRAEARRKLWAA